MIEKSLNSIPDLLHEVADIRKLIESNQRHEHHVLAKTLFRGQSRAEWSLDTTLERFTRQSTHSAYLYDAQLQLTHPVVSSYTGKSWPLEENAALNENYFTPPNYEYMAYVRHHGFPTPLLDWTESIYVSLFFAYHGAVLSEDVAIYTYVQSLKGISGGFVGEPEICLLGPYIETHKRHFQQQGRYTVAVKYDENKNWVYCPHDKVFDTSNSVDQDMLYKFTMPGELKESVLEQLNEMNINAYSLYSSEDSLMDTLAHKELMFRKQI